MAIWFETKVTYDKMMQNGLVKKVTESYLVEALSFTEAEARTIEARQTFISGGFTVKAAKRTKITEVFFNDNEDAKWYQVKWALVMLDEEPCEKGLPPVEKKTNCFSMVQAIDLDAALKLFHERMINTLCDYEVVSIAETQILEIYPLNTSETDNGEVTEQ